jgi:sodium transport system permease protein
MGMKLKKVFSVFRKEFKDTLRDRRTVMVMILVPIVLYPLLFSLMGQMMMVGKKNLESEKSQIAFIPDLPPLLDSLLHEDKNLEMSVSPNPAEDLTNRKVHAWLEVKNFVKKDSIFVYFDAAMDRSRLARDRLETLIDSYKDQLKAEILVKHGLQPESLDPIGFRQINTAPPSRMGAMILGVMIPMLLLVTLVLGAMYPAIDLTAGEKERGTLETILTVPVSRLELLMGKYLTVSTIALITGTLNLISMWLAYALGFIQLGMAAGKLEFSFSPVNILILFIVIIPLALFISAAVLSVSIFARSFKDAQNLVTPLYLILMLPAIITSVPGIELNNVLALVPIVNVSLLFKEIMLNNYSFEMIFAVFLSNTIFAALTLLIFSKLFNAEEVLFGEAKGLQFSFRRQEIQSAAVFDPSSALLVLTILFLFLFYIGSITQLKFKEWGVFATEWALIFLPVLLAIWYNKINFKTALNLKGFSLLALAGTLLITFGGLGSTIWVGQLQIKLFPEAGKIGEAIEKVLNLEKTGFSPILGFLIFAISPAICEEVLFRGVLLSAFKKKFSATLSIVLVGFLFGLFHLHIFRIIPTAIIGIYLSFIVYHTGSLYLSIIAHALNNGVALLIISYPTVRQALSGIISENEIPLPVLLTCLLMLAGGLYIVWKSKKDEVMN